MRRTQVGFALAAVLAAAVLMPISLSAAPSFDCAQVREGSIEKLICDDATLSVLDHKLAEVFQAALSKDQTNPHSILTAEQRGWIKGRNECWKSSDPRMCVEDNYLRRIAELQARYRLLKASRTTSYECEKNAANEIVVHFFETTPKVIVAEHGDNSYLLFKESDAEQYQGGNEIISFDDNSLEASLAYDAPALRCQMKDMD